jgi:WD40 repeat protein
MLPATPAPSPWDAFICYRRSDGRAAARWLYLQLRRFRPPREFGAWTPLRVFLDEATERASNDFYISDILPALTSSLSLIVVCTRSSDVELKPGEPNWQQREILDYLKLHPDRTIVPVIVDGDFDRGPLPNSLHQRFPNIHRVDGRGFRRRLWGLRPLVRNTLRGELVDIAGATRSVARDRMDLLHRLDARSQIRRLVASVLWLTLAAAAFAFVTVLAVRARDARQVELVGSLTRQGAKRVEEAPTSAALLFARAVELADGSADLDEAARSWLGILDFSAEKSLSHRAPVRAGAFHPKGTRIATGADDGQVVLWTPDGKVVARMRHDKGVTSLAFSPDGVRLVSTSWDGTVRLWDSKTGSGLHTLKHDQAVNLARFSPDGKTLVSAGWDDKFRVWSVDSGKPLADGLPSKHMAYAIDFDPKGRTLITGDHGGNLCIYDTNGWQKVRDCYQQKAGITAARFSASGAKVALVTHFGAVDLLDSLSWQPLELEPEQGEATYAVAFSPVDDRVLAYGGQRRARIWMQSDQDRRVAFELPHKGAVRDIGFTRDGQYVLTASDDGTARLRGSRTGHDAVLPFDHLGTVFCALLSPDEKMVLTCGADGLARLRSIASRSLRVFDVVDEQNDRMSFDTIAIDQLGGRVFLGNNSGRVLGHRLTDGARVAQLEANMTGILGVDDLVVDPPGKRLGVVGGEGPVRMFDLAHLDHPPTLLGSPGDYANIVAFDKAGTRVFVGYTGGEVQAFWAADGKPLFDRTPLPATSAPPDGADGPRVKSLAVQSAAELFVSGHEDGRVYVWSFAGRRLEHDLRHDRDVVSVAFSPDDRLLLTAGGDGKLKLWDARAGFRLVQTLVHGGAVVAASFSPDGTAVVSAGDDNTAVLWSVEDGEPLIPRLRHGQNLWSVELNHTGRLILTASQDATAQLWDARLGEPIGPPLRHRATVTIARFSPDGKYVVTGSSDGRATIWRVPRYEDPARGIVERLEQATGLKLDPETLSIRVAD